MTGMRRHRSPALAVAAVLMIAATMGAAQVPPSPMLPDNPPDYRQPEIGFDYEKRAVMIPMRDGVKLATVLMVPKGAKAAPIVLTRTPYNAMTQAAPVRSPHLAAALPLGDDVFAGGDYIRVYQDVRGKYRSEGDYIGTRPLRGPLNSSTTDESTDAFDTIDWLVKHVAESNGRVGMIGYSAPGFMVAMALVNPHPALKVAAPEQPQIDGWMGDDWFHHGAFRQSSFGFIARRSTSRQQLPATVRGPDDYDAFLRAGSAGGFAAAEGLEDIPQWRKMSGHPAYDEFWREQALDRILARQSLTVPVLWVHGWWDQEDAWGALHGYAAMEPKDHANTMNFLVAGPWHHGQMDEQGYALGPLRWEGDTARQFRRDLLKPFFDQYLKPRAPNAGIAPVTVYNTGDNRWEKASAWPLSCRQGCAARSKPLFFTSGFGLSFDRPATGEQSSDSYVSDPAKPVPYTPQPARFYGSDWTTWLVGDQRFAANRPDVLNYTTAPLLAPVHIAGTPLVNLVAATSGSDSDWVVKLIDLYPDDPPHQPEMAGYQLAVSLNIFRGRYRESAAAPKAITPGKPLAYRFSLPAADHVFLPGHRIMVQVQSTLFPLYDRNPQTFVPNIFHAKAGDYRAATQRVYHGGAQQSFIELPVVDGAH